MKDGEIDINILCYRDFKILDSNFILVLNIQILMGYLLKMYIQFLNIDDVQDIFFVMKDYLIFKV